jgi:AcrR family transcriptional regulator
MEATGLEKGGIYRHFDSKQQLAAEAFDYAWKLALDTRFGGTQAMVSRLQRNDDSRGWACRHLEEYLESNVRAARKNPGENR